MPEFTPSGSMGSLTSDATAWVASRSGSLSARLAQYMKQYGITSAWFTYERTFSVPSANEPTTVTRVLPRQKVPYGTLLQVLGPIPAVMVQWI